MNWILQENKKSKFRNKPSRFKENTSEMQAVCRDINEKQ